MKTLIIILLSITFLNAFEITTIAYTSDEIMNYYISVFMYLTAVLVSFFAILAIMAR